MPGMTTPVHGDRSTATERDAGRRASTWAATLEAKVLAVVVAAGEDGLTAVEAREALGMGVERQYSVAPRLSVMARHKGWVEPTGEARGNYQAYRATAAGRAQVGAS